MDAMDPNLLRLYGVQTVEYVARYWEQMDMVAPLATVRDGSRIVSQLPEDAPDLPDEWYSIISDVENIIMPGVTHWQSPNFHGHFPAATSFPSICANVMSDGIGCSWIPSPACTALETVVMNWMGKMLQLPADFLNTEGSTGGGILQESGNESLHTAMLVARDRALEKLKKDEEEANNIIDVVSLDGAPEIKNNIASVHNEIISYCSSNENDGTSTVKFIAETRIRSMKEQETSKKPEACIHERLVAYTSEEAHNSVERACWLASVTCRKLPTDEEYSLRGQTLEKAIQEDMDAGNIPFMVVATLGTKSCVSFDNLVEIGDIAKREGLWLHVDAAYAGASFICPEFRQPMDGMEQADSFSFSPHKWLLVNLECSALWLKNAEGLEINSEIQEDALDTDVIPDFRQYQIAPGRRFRSLKVWFVLRMFGLMAMRQQILKQVELAKEFEKLLMEDDRFELVGPNSLGVICFRLKGSNEDNVKLCERINNGGKIFITKALVKGSEPLSRVILRFAICSPLTKLKHVEAGWAEIKRHTGDNAEVELKSEA